MRCALIASLVLTVSVLPAAGAADQEASYIFVPGSGERLPCYIGSSPSSSQPIHMGRSGIMQQEIQVPAASNYCECHGWPIPEACAHFLTMEPEQISQFIQAHSLVTMLVNGVEMPPMRIEVRPIVPDEPEQPSPGGGDWLVHWCFELPSGLIQTGVFVVTVTWFRDEQLTCAPEGAATWTNTVTASVLVTGE